MKKLLILMLVLGMASTASAVLTTSLSGSGDTTSATIDLIGAGSTIAGEAATNFMVYADDGLNGVFSLSSITMVFGGNGSAITDAMANAGGFEALLSLPAGAVKAAKQIDIKDLDFLLIPNGTLVTSSTTGSGTAYLLDTGGVTLDTYTVVPEPMTIALLGLGGLFLRRRKVA